MALRQAAFLLKTLASNEASTTASSFLRTAASVVASKEGKALHPDLLNESVKKTQYAVRGELYLRAVELQEQGTKITFTNGALQCCAGTASWACSNPVLCSSSAKQARTSWHTYSGRPS